MSTATQDNPFAASGRRAGLWAGLALVGVIAVISGPTASYPFVAFDDRHSMLQSPVRMVLWATGRRRISSGR